MSFININKVSIPDCDKIEQMLGGTQLVIASILYDAIQEKDWSTALRYAEVAQYAAHQVAVVVKMAMEKAPTETGKGTS